MIETKIMEFKGFKAKIMEAERLKGDHIHGLPSGIPLTVYHSDSFVKYPENWMKGPGVFVVPVQPEKGLWFDWTLNDGINTAVLPTVKGCNPITGLKTDGFHLERYDEKCPKHKISFRGDRYCPDCDYKWPVRNYISAPSILWWDGFRSNDGTVRQFFFTEDPMRDVPSGLIGKKNTVPAFGFAFYTPKKHRIKKEDIKIRGLYYNSYSYCGNLNQAYLSENFGYSTAFPTKIYQNSENYSVSYNSSDANFFVGDVSTEIKTSACLDGLKTNVIASAKGERKNRRKSCADVSIGAGAKIKQELQADIYALDTWKDVPDASMVIYFVFQEKFEELKAGGFIDLSGKEEGMLANVPVG